MRHPEGVQASHVAFIAEKAHPSIAVDVVAACDCMQTIEGNQENHTIKHCHGRRRPSAIQGYHKIL